MLDFAIAAKTPATTNSTTNSTIIQTTTNKPATKTTTPKPNTKTTTPKPSKTTTTSTTTTTTPAPPKRPCPSPCNCPTEDTIDCSRNNLTAMVDLTNVDLSNVRIFNLSNNALRVVDLHLPEETKLEILDISRNNLSAFSLKRTSNKMDLHDDRLRLEILDLSQNNLSSLDPTILEFANETATINLARNPWHCDCDESWTKTIHTIGNMHCASPEMYKDIDVAIFLTECSNKQSQPSVSVDMKIALILLVLLVASLIAGSMMAVKHNSFCRRLIGREQYSSVYYTKAEFGPMDTL